MTTKKINAVIKASRKTSYPIFIGEKLLENADDYIQKYLNSKKFLIVTNPTVYKHWGDKLKISGSEILMLPDGEEYKNIDSLNVILDRALDMNLDRGCAFVAFGGGVIGDVTGFAASVFQRGVDFVQIPTTLLSQVDSSVGGKTAVNKPQGKNLIGTFYQPKLVLSDINTLNTLDERQYKTGLAEVVKYAFIEKSSGKNYNFFEYLNKNISKILNRNMKTLSKIIEISCKIKSAVVNKDEKEKGLREILNFGHTYAHALEKCTNYNIFTHGEAVAVGMQAALDLSYAMGLISDDCHERSSKLIEMFDFEIPLHDKINPEDILSAIKYDKKVRNGKIRFVAAVGESEVNTVDNISENLLLKIIS